MHRSRQSGVGLIELMVALVIGLFLILGAVTVFSQSRSTYRTAESVARLQEIGRLAMDVVETDVRMANFWGMSNRADYIVNRAPIGQPPPAELNGTQQANAAVCGTTSGTGNYFVINLDEYIGGSNNSYALTCAANSYQAGTDTLWIRRANSTQPVTMDANRIYLQTSRIQGTLFVPASGCTNPTNQACIPADYLPPASMSRELEAHVYYVSSTSTNRNDVPSLRRKRFANVNGTTANAFIDEEIVPGVEDLQVRLGVDTNGDTNIDQYVEPGRSAGQRRRGLGHDLAAHPRRGTRSRLRRRHGIPVCRHGIRGDTQRQLPAHPAHQDDPYPEHTLMTTSQRSLFPQAGPRRETGAALVVGLILLLVLTLLAISGMTTASLELQMAGNAQYQERAFQRADAGVEQAMAAGIYDTNITSRRLRQRCRREPGAGARHGPADCQLRRG